MSCPPTRCTRRGVSVRWSCVMALLAITSMPLVRGGALIEDIPDELVEEMKAAHPGVPLFNHAIACPRSMPFF